MAHQMVYITGRANRGITAFQHCLRTRTCRLIEEVWFAADSPVEGAGFEPSVPRQESRRFEPASVPSRGGRYRRGGDGPGGDRRPDRAVDIADRRCCASEPLRESRIKPSRRVGPSRGTDGSNPSPSREESPANSISARCRGRKHENRSGSFEFSAGNAYAVILNGA